MANHKSALKRARQSQLRRLRNRGNRSRMKNAVKAVVAAIEENSVDKAQEALKSAIPIIEKTAVKGSIHKKNASRKVSRLTRRVNAFVTSQQGNA
ncbi:30S ribosomal protein S20 [Thermodesulfobacteriota bacterium]